MAENAQRVDMGLRRVIDTDLLAALLVGCSDCAGGFRSIICVDQGRDIFGRGAALHTFKSVL